ncbi:MAG: hypothetical protein ACRDV1_01120 [Actinomycetes bacterium]
MLRRLGQRGGRFPALGGETLTWPEAWDRMLRAITDDEATNLAPQPTEAAVAEAVSHVVRLRAYASFVEALADGASGPRALIACVRKLSRRKRFREALALADAVEPIVGLTDAAHAARAVVAVRRGSFATAEEHLAAIPRDVALDLVPSELVAVEFTVDPAVAIATCSRLLSDADAVDNGGEGADQLGPDDWIGLARATFGRGELELSERMLGRFRTSSSAPPRHLEEEARWLERWLVRASSDRRPAPVPAGHVSFAILDYKQPDYRQVSINVGDYVQTLASLGHLVRHQGVRFHGDAELVASLTELQGRVQPARLMPGVERDVSVLTVNRDASSLDAVPEGTWMLAFGWYMHNWFKVRYDFPFHHNLQPIFVSFHVNKRETLSEESIAYLRESAPIGCRDWETVHHLLGLDVPAFFSGCLTTTVDMLFPAEPPRPAAGAPVAFVDLLPGKEPAIKRRSVAVRHSNPKIRDASFVTNLELAVKMLEAYRRDFSRVVTSRLHCYLPVRALGVDVRFRPKKKKDIRFDGLIGIDDATFASMQQGLRDKLAVVVSSILAGDEEKVVRAAWHEACSADVEAARRRHLALSHDDAGMPV